MPDLLLVIGTVLVNHFVLTGIAGRSLREPEAGRFATAKAIALATGSSLLLTLLALGAQRWLLTPLDASYLQWLILVAVASGATWLVSLFLERARSQRLRYSGLVTANSIVLTLALQQATGERDAFASGVLAVTLAAGFGVLLLALTELLHRIDPEVPAPFRGAPLAFITAGLAALALLGFTGLLPG